MSKQIDFKKQENKNINIKKGFSSVLLLDIPLKDFSLNEANNNILNNSMEKINSCNNLLPNDLIKQINSISPNLSQENLNSEELIKLSNLDFESDCSQDSFSSYNREKEEFQLNDNLSYQNINEIPNENKENFIYQFSENSYNSTTYSSYKINLNEKENIIFNHHLSINPLYNNYSITQNLQNSFNFFSFNNINKNNILRKNSFPQNFNFFLNEKNKKKKKKSKKKLKDEFTIEMFGRRGWVCEKCDNFNYECRNKCNRCKLVKKPKKISKKKFQSDNCLIKEKDLINSYKENWLCSYCQNLNFAFRYICNRCSNKKNQ